MRLKTPYYYWGNMRTCKGSMVYIAIAILNKNKSATITFGLEVTLPPIWKLSKNSQTMVWSSLTRKPLHQARVQGHSQPHSLLRRESSESPHLQGGNIRVDKIVKNQNTSFTSIGGGRLVSSGRIVKV